MTAPTRGCFEHAVLVADSDAAIDQLLVPVLRNHISAEEPVLLVVGPRTERIVRDRLGASAGVLEWGESDAFYQRLGFAYEGFRRYLQQAQSRGVHVIAEPDIPTYPSVDRIAAYLSYEAMCNVVYADYGCPVTCIWDSRSYPAPVIEAVRSVHSHELTEEGSRRNAAFVPADDYLTTRAHVSMQPVPQAVDVDLTLSEMDQLGVGRAAIRAWATTRGFGGAATDQIATATNEVVTNGLRHGRPPVRLRAWHHGTTLVVQVDDRGGLPVPPDAGYLPPGAPSAGLGFWMTRQFADVVLTESTANLTTVRMYFPHALTTAVT